MMTLLLLLFGCPSREAECDAENACPLGSVCIDGTCESRSCATSEQCGIEQYCNGGSCVDGCAEHNDCMFGDVCDVETNACVAAECTDTHVDCGFGQFCGPNGECFEAGGYYCHPCEDDGDCGGNGNLCYGGFCGVTCETDQDCPQAYDCVPFSDWAGNIITHQCITECESGR